jgi:phytoene synthase
MLLHPNSSGAVTIEESYRYCRREAKRAGSSFCWSFWMLPAHQRQAMNALYAFSRRTDDLGDSEGDNEAKRAALDAWRNATRRALDGERRDKLLPALADAVKRFGIDEQSLFDLIDGVAMDLSVNRYETWPDLKGYCYKVASVVGLACIRIWGVSNDEAGAMAVDCGYALQLTNILRDLKEDAEHNRIYLPLEDLARFGYAPADLFAGKCDEKFIDLMRFEIARAEGLYETAAPLARHLAPAPRRVFGLMTGAYRRLLQKIGRRPGDVLQRRIRLTWRNKAALMRETLLGGGV